MLLNQQWRPFLPRCIKQGSQSVAEGAPAAGLVPGPGLLAFGFLHGGVRRSSPSHLRGEAVLLPGREPWSARTRVHRQQVLGSAPTAGPAARWQVWEEDLLL